MNVNAPTTSMISKYLPEYHLDDIVGFRLNSVELLRCGCSSQGTVTVFKSVSCTIDTEVIKQVESVLRNLVNADETMALRRRILASWWLLFLFMVVPTVALIVVFNVSSLTAFYAMLGVEVLAFIISFCLGQSVKKGKVKLDDQIMNAIRSEGVPQFAELVPDYDVKVMGLESAFFLRVSGFVQLKLRNVIPNARLPVAEVVVEEKDLLATV